MPRPHKAEEAILLASSNSAVADYLVQRAEGWQSILLDSISEKTEAALLERDDRLIDLRLAEYCVYETTAQTLFQRDPKDWALRSLLLSNQMLDKTFQLSGFPKLLFGDEDNLKTYLSTIVPDDVIVLFANPTLNDSFLENVLASAIFGRLCPNNPAVSHFAASPPIRRCIVPSMSRIILTACIGSPQASPLMPHGG